MPRDFFPRPDADAVSFTANFSSRINADPELYHVTPETAAAYAVLQAAFAQALSASNIPSTRCKLTTEVKQSARRAVEAATRPIAGRIRNASDLTAEQKIVLGLKSRSKPTRTPRPVSAPFVRVASVAGSVLTVQLIDTESGKPRKPGKANCACLYTAVGESPPASIRDWAWAGASNRTKRTITLPPHVHPGTKVWVTARWTSPRWENGPLADPACTHIGHGITSRASIKAS